MKLYKITTTNVHEEKVWGCDRNELVAYAVNKKDAKEIAEQMAKEIRDHGCTVCLTGNYNREEYVISIDTMNIETITPAEYASGKGDHFVRYEDEFEFEETEEKE